MKKIAALGVVCVIVCGLIAFFLLPDREISPVEYRTLAQAPDFKPGRFFDAALRTETEDYIADQFPLRDFLLSLYRKWVVRHPALPGGGAREVIESEEPYQYYVFGENLILQPDTWKKSTAEADLFTDFMREAGALCAEKDVDLFLDFVPSKVESLHDLLPAGAEPSRDLELLNGIREKLPENCALIPTMDAFEALSAGEKSAMYFHTDHHWNARGAGMAFEVLCGALQNRGFAADHESFGYTETLIEKPFSGSYNRNLGTLYSQKEDIPLRTPRAGLRDSLVWDTGGEPIAENAVYGRTAERDVLTYGDLYTADLPYLHIRNDNAPNDYHLLVIKDSFYNALAAELPLLFREVTAVDPRHISDFTVSDALEKYKPDGLLFFYCSSLLYKTSETITYSVK